jgi:hypothetical protein
MFHLKNTDMRTLLKLLLIICTVVIAVACSNETLLDDQAPDLKGKMTGPEVIMVAPGGGDDTENLLNAFAEAMSYGPGNEVRLGEGIFHTDLIEVRDFCGSFTGGGKGKTIITTIDDLSIDKTDDLNLYPVLLKFVGGNVTMSGMTITTPPGSLSTGVRDWLEGLVGFFGYSQYIEPAGRYINVVFDNVEIIGSTDNVGYGLMTGSDSQGMEGGVPLSNIDISVTNSYFSDCAWYGACIMMIKEGSLIVGTHQNGNIFENIPNRSLGFWHNTSVRAKVMGNIFFNPAGTGFGLEIYSAPYPALLEQVPQIFQSVYSIEQNEFNISGGTGGILVNDNRRGFYPDEMPMAVHVKNNRFNMSNNAFTGMGCINMSGMLIRNNMFSGTGSWGVRIFRQSAIYNENGLMLGNNFSNTSYSDASVLLNTGTRNWTIVGGNLGKSIQDYGENNIITGFTVNNSEEPPGETIVDNLEAMRDALKTLRKR